MGPSPWIRFPLSCLVFRLCRYFWNGCSFCSGHTSEKDTILYRYYAILKYPYEHTSSSDLSTFLTRCWRTHPFCQQWWCLDMTRQPWKTPQSSFLQRAATKVRLLNRDSESYAHSNITILLVSFPPPLSSLLME